ncbi:jmj4, partial [Symbiodinium sp. KB8]
MVATPPHRYLKAAAGQCTVEVERRTDGTGRFGLGRVEPMRYGDFLTALDDGDETLYLTTQPLEEDKDGPTAMASAPVTQLLDDFPLSPCPPLVVDQWNLWQGLAREGSTSGLHHDTHDNIYVLLRGSKRFRLFAPSDALRLHTAGSITHVHPNGVINYGVPTRADGAAEASAIEWASDTAQATAAATAARAEELKAAGAPANEVREAEEAAAAADAAADAALDAVLALAGDASEGGSS